MYWTKKYDEFCLAISITPSARLLYAWIIRKTKSDTATELEIDLNDFNRWVAKKRGKPFDRKTLRLAIAQLLDRTEGLVVEMKKISWYYYKLIVRPLSYLPQEQKPKLGTSPQNKTGNPASFRDSTEEKLQQQQQNISKIDNFLQKVGLKYDAQALNRIWRLSNKCFQRIVKAVELLLYRHQTSPVNKPHGFLIECLKHNWQEGFELYYQPELPQFNSTAQLSSFISSIQLS